jgi:hypothetical protein
MLSVSGNNDRYLGNRAPTRRGWRRDDAETWPVRIAEEAFIEAYHYDWDPWRAAEADVIDCEEPL